MPSSKKWEITAELDLCMAVILTGGSTSTYKWPEIHTIMCQLGHDFTKDAISQHFTKCILRGFKARHGLGAGRLPDNIDKSPGKRRQLVDASAGGSPAKKRKSGDAATLMLTCRKE
ncbi:hypothetical protein E4U55_005447 [Claviceps digitariae]|nr:hypothetical protein E4U55_005447 [Claviceps digitariae]